MVSDKPDAAEKGIRFGCGFVFGAVASFASLVWFWPSDLSVMVIALCGVGIVCGGLATWYGDAFWKWLARNSWWLRF